MHQGLSDKNAALEQDLNVLQRTLARTEMRHSKTQQDCLEAKNAKMLLNSRQNIYNIHILLIILGQSLGIIFLGKNN